MEAIEILKKYKNIAIVGISDKPDRPSNEVARYLMENSDLNLYFVNPLLTQVLGQTVYPSLLEIPEKVEIVDIFRKASEIPALVPDAIKIGAKVFWMQLGIENAEARAAAQKAGIEVVENKCTAIEWQKYLRSNK